MDFEALLKLGWREALIAIIALLVLYVGVVLFRMRRLRHAAMQSAVSPQTAAATAVAAYAAVQEPEVAASSAPPVHPDEPSFAWNEPPEPFAGQARIEALERETVQLRHEVASLRAELRVVDEDLHAAREELQRALLQTRTVQNASPLYSDAMQMAIQGHSAAEISEHCGIARAEAELVVALVRNSDQENR